MTIRSLFSTRRPIDRPIEKVIDYYADDDKRVAAEIEEYEATENVEWCFRRFLDVYGEGTRGGLVTEIGVWVSGFYGSGKSSFTKYLGFALDPSRVVGGRHFLDLLCDRLMSAEVKASLRTVAAKQPTAVILLDLGAEQFADAASAPVSSVLYWKVLQWAGYSREKKLAQLEFTLDERRLADRFRQAHRERFGGEWEQIHNDPLIGVARAAQIVPELLPREFPTPESFRGLRFDDTVDVRKRAEHMITLVRRRTGRQNILFLIDEAGQYVAPRQDLILNLDGLSRSLKELGQGKVWIVATGQQTLTEILEKAAYNSAELNKLRDRFPISIDLDARDIREITYRRLLTKSPAGERRLKDEFGRHGQALVAHTRLVGTTLFKSDPDVETFTRLYPFLPQHFDLLLELIRTLARTTGGIGLRSAIRVIQDLLVDASKVLSADAVKVADRPIGDLTCADDFYNTLRPDIAKVLPHVVAGVDRVATVFAIDSLAVRVAKAIAALQSIENFPRTAENIAALLYARLGQASQLVDVREVLHRLVAAKECSLIEDPQAGGYLFLSEKVKPLRDKRNAYVPTAGQVVLVRSKVLEALLEASPSVKLENVKEVKAEIKYGRATILGEGADVQFRIEAVGPGSFEARRKALLAETNQSEFKNAIAWLSVTPPELDDLLVEICRSEAVLSVPEREADKDVAQFLRAERRLADDARDRAKKLLETALVNGTFVFRGLPRPVTECGETLAAATRTQLGQAAAEVFPQLRLVPVRPATELAARFLAVERLDRMPRELDPLGLVATQGGPPRIGLHHPALVETLRAFQERADLSGAGRLQGNALQDFFAGPPYGWSKDATRYLFAALLRAGEVELHTPGGVVQTVGQLAQEAMKSTLAFNRVGVSRRNTRPSLEALDRAATNLQEMFGQEVLPLEEQIGRAVRKHFPWLVEKVAALPDRLRLLGLPGEGRARTLLETAADLLKQDASDAPAVLGAVDCRIPADAKWARAASDALATAESDISLARRIQHELGELAQLFPEWGAALLSPEEAATIEEALGAESFHEQLPALRSATRSALGRVTTRYRDRHVLLLEASRQALQRLEAMPEWIRIAPEDREDVARRVTGVLPPDVPVAGREIAGLRLLLTREAALPAQLAGAEAEVRRRVPPPVPTPAGEPDEASEQTISLLDLAPTDVLRSMDDLEAWLASVRTRLTELLAVNRQVRVKP